MNTNKWLGFFKDAFGNTFSIYQRFSGWAIDGSAKHNGAFDVIDCADGSASVFKTLPSSYKPA